MRTKDELLEVMAHLGACGGAIDWVTRHELDLASDIWGDCTRVDWMVWFAFRLIPGRGFAYACADRAVRVYGKTGYAPMVYDITSAEAALTGVQPTHWEFPALKAAIAADTKTGRYSSEATSTASNSAICAALDKGYRLAEHEMVTQLSQLLKLWPQLVEAARV